MNPPDSLDLMRQVWVRLLEGYRVTATDGGPVFDLLVAAHSAPDRHYHNLEHLGEMFRAAARLATITDDLASVQLAIWFHDAVYDPRAKDNETRSADLATTLLGPIGVPRSELERVMKLILATAHLAEHPIAGDRETAILLDADLAILAASTERYRRYAADVRKEYAWVPDEHYRAGRTAVLNQFLARPRIYLTDLAHQEDEERARSNMTAERDALSAGK
jgi:predicted metal-dependent HD superfamily phosphohydrolase